MKNSATGKETVEAGNDQIFQVTAPDRSKWPHIAVWIAYLIDTTNVLATLRPRQDKKTEPTEYEKQMMKSRSF